MLPTIAAVFVALSIFTNNPLVLHLRFWGLTKSLHQQVEIGELKVRDLQTASIKLRGTRKIEGDTLAFVTIQYPKTGKAPDRATAELAGMRGKVTNFTFEGYLVLPKSDSKRRVFAMVEPNRMSLDVEDAAGTLRTGYGAAVPMSASKATVTNPARIIVKRPNATAVPQPRGELNVTLENLNLQRVALSFGEGSNTLEVSATAQMPAIVKEQDDSETRNHIVWSYDLSDNIPRWLNGHMEVKDIAVRPVPARQIDFGGVVLNLTSITMASVQVTKKNTVPASLAVARVEELSIDATQLNYKNSTLKGRLTKPITIKELEAEIEINGIDLKTPTARLRDLALRLADADFRDQKGLEFHAKTMEIDVVRYSTHRSYELDPSTQQKKEKSNDDVSASLKLNGGSVKTILKENEVPVGTAAAEIEELTAQIVGPMSSLAGRGALTANITELNTTLKSKPEDTIKDLKCNGGNPPLEIDVRLITPAKLKADIAIFAGVPAARGIIDVIAVSFQPKPWKCEWDQEITLKIPTFNLGLPQVPGSLVSQSRQRPSGIVIGAIERTSFQQLPKPGDLIPKKPEDLIPKPPQKPEDLIPKPPQKPEDLLKPPLPSLPGTGGTPSPFSITGTQDFTVKVRWLAELHPIPGAGSIVFADLKFDRKGPQLCGGHALALGGFWTPATGPNFPDCGHWWCNIPRDVLRGAYAIGQFPIGLGIGSLLNSAMSSLGATGGAGALCR